MGNAIRLGIARIGLAVHSFWTGRRGKKPSVVLLVLGTEEVGKSTIASRILKQGKNIDEESVYVPTKGFSIVELKDRGTSVRLFDLGGSEIVRELWTHYYPDAHGIIFVIDTSGRSGSIGEQAQVLGKVLQDERIKRKPLLVLGNKQDLEPVQAEQLITQTDLIQVVNTAKCLTRVDMTSKVKIEGFDDGLMIGFRWMIAYVKWHWAELNERVEHDTILERSQENAKFEARHLPKSMSDTSLNLMGQRRSAVGCPSPPPENLDEVVTENEVPLTNQNEAQVLFVLPQTRLDPEGGNDVKEWKPDATHQVVLQHDTEDEFPEVLIVESQAEVHIQRPRSESSVTLRSTTLSVDGALGPSDPKDVPEKPVEKIVPNSTTSATTKRSRSASRPKLFRNKTAPVRDEPIRIPIMANSHHQPTTTTGAIFQI